jgi:translation initiation factor IF-1
VVEVVGPGLVRLELANGHRLLAHAARREQAAVATVTVGERLTVEMSPFDMSSGRILVNRKKKTETEMI